MKTACVLLADGFEEVEAITPIDYLRRAGIEVHIVGVTGKTVSGSHGIRVEAGLGAEGFNRDYDCIVVPGGGRGADNIAACSGRGLPDQAPFRRRRPHSGDLRGAGDRAPRGLRHPEGQALHGLSGHRDEGPRRDIRRGPRRD